MPDDDLFHYEAEHEGLAYLVVQKDVALKPFVDELPATVSSKTSTLLLLLILIIDVVVMIVQPSPSLTLRTTC